jgi:PAS domain S-box-containing protein
VTSRFESNEAIILIRAVDDTNEGFVTIDEDHKIVHFNKAAEKIFGYTKSEVVGRDLDVIMGPSCIHDHRSAVERYIKTRVPKRIGHETELVAVRKGGKKFPASISFSVTEIENRLFFTGIIRDLTEIHELRDKTKRAERLATIGQFVAEVTHEIKNPLMLIGGFAGQLEREIEEKESLKKLKIISEEVSRLEKLLQDLGELYRPDPMAKEEISVRDLLKDLYAFVEDDCEGKNINIRLECDDSPLLVEGNQDRLRQVFLNLIKNSIDAMENGGTLTLHCERAGDYVKILVKDDGCGLSEEDIQEVFSPFFTKKKHGTGLGLSVSKRIIEDHKGHIVFLKSEEGKGTEIQISLPALNE